MKSNRQSLKTWFMLLSTVLIIGAVMGTTTGGGAQPLQVGLSGKATPKPKKIPTDTPTLTATPTLAPTSTSTPPPAPGPDGTWNIVSSPNTGWPGNTLYGVSAVASNDVWAVGYSGNGNTSSQVIEHWNGTSWSLAQAPSLSAPNQLLAVAAVASNDVWAVGVFYTTGLSIIEHWNGSSWSVIQNPNPGTLNVFNGVAAISSNNVWAVGYFVNGGVSQTLVEHWNGSSWSVIPSPNLGTDYNQLTAVTAVPGSPNELWAVGYVSTNTTLTMHWDGTQWSIVPSPNIGTNNYLYGVTAVSSNDIWAVGYANVADGQDTVTLHWDGSTWSVIPSPNPSTIANQLLAVTALAANNVWAVGYYNNYQNGYGGLAALFLQWNGTSWVQVPGDNSFLTGSSQLYSVDAISANDIWSVGVHSSTLAEHWNGAAWSTVPTPNSGVGQNELYSVNGTSSTDIWSVGYYKAGLESRTLVEHWNGTQWSIIPSPNVTNLDTNVLKSVVAISTSNAWAVGYAENIASYGRSTLILHWDGVSWGIITSPSLGTLSGELDGIVANSATDIWAMGSSMSSDSYAQTLVEHWNGSTWSVIPSPNVAGTNNQLYAGLALGTGSVWAAGYYGAYTYAPLVEKWDGTSWSIVPSPNRLSVYSDIFYGISGAGSSDIWAVGNSDYTPNGNNSSSLVEHWNGSSWGVVISPSTSSYTFLRGAAAVSAGDAWAVGSDGTYPLIERWNGSTWNIFTSPQPSGGYALYSVMDISQCDVWAVGSSYPINIQVFQTLIEHFTCQ